MKYSMTIGVDGYMDIDIEAESPKDAIRKAIEHVRENYVFAANHESEHDKSCELDEVSLRCAALYDADNRIIY